MAMGALRKAYSADCRFFTDEPDRTNRINWYLVPDDRPCFELPTVFFPQVDHEDGTDPCFFERTGPGRIVRTFNEGIDIYGFDGSEFHGDEADFLGQSKAKKYWVGDIPPVAPCDGIPEMFFPIALAFSASPVFCTSAGIAALHPTLDVSLHSPDDALWPDLTITLSVSIVGVSSVWAGTVFIDDDVWHVQIVATDQPTSDPLFTLSGGFSDSTHNQNAYGPGIVTPQCDPPTYFASAFIYDVVAGAYTGTRVEFTL